MSFIYGELAQLGEHLPCTQGVKGSNPLFSTTSASKTQKSMLCDEAAESESANVPWKLNIYFVYKQVNNENEIEKILSLIRVFLRERG